MNQILIEQARSWARGRPACRRSARARGPVQGDDVEACGTWKSVRRPPSWPLRNGGWRGCESDGAVHLYRTQDRMVSTWSCCPSVEWHHAQRCACGETTWLDLAKRILTVVCVGSNSAQLLDALRRQLPIVPEDKLGAWRGRVGLSPCWDSWDRNSLLAHMLHQQSRTTSFPRQLLHEIHLLCQMLEDGNAERSIPVSMAMEEVPLGAGTSRSSGMPVLTVDTAATAPMCTSWRWRLCIAHDVRSWRRTRPLMVSSALEAQLGAVSARAWTCRVHGFVAVLGVAKRETACGESPWRHISGTWSSCRVPFSRFEDGTGGRPKL